MHIEIASKVASIMNWNHCQMSPIKQDGSSRQYFRASSSQGKSLVLMQLDDQDSSLLQRHCYPWLALHKILSQESIRVPLVIEILHKQGAILLEDLGNQTLGEWMTQNQHPLKVDAIFDKIFDNLKLMSNIDTTKNQPWTNLSFDTQKLFDEMLFFIDHFVTPYFHDLVDEKQLLHETHNLCKTISPFSNTFTHRDFHSGNIMLKNQELCIIDFQDARIGPKAYDLVSLCFDPYLPITSKRRKNLFDLGINRLGNSQELQESWRPVLLQRLLKALGSFAFLSHVIQRGDYMKHAPSAIQILSTFIEQDSRFPYLSGEFLRIMKDKKSWEMRI